MGIELNGAQRRCNASTSNLMTLHEKCGSEPALHLSPRLNHLLTQRLPHLLTQRLPHPLNCAAMCLYSA